MTALLRSRLFWLNLGLVVFWGGVIWTLGGGDFSFSDTSRIIGPLIEWLFPDLTFADKRFWLRFVRKCAHVAEYGVFAVLVLRLVIFLRDRPIAAQIALALGATLLLALLDEGRQGLLSNRTGSPRDVALDVTGGAVGIAVAMALATAAGGHLLGIPGFGARAQRRGGSGRAVPHP